VSIETTRARIAADAAERDWKSHRQQCAECTRARRSRRPAESCDRGGALRGDWRKAVRDLAANVALDKQPSSGQTVLF
jgi:hypothetical protein